MEKCFFFYKGTSISEFVESLKVSNGFANKVWFWVMEMIFCGRKLLNSRKTFKNERMAWNYHHLKFITVGSE